MNMRAVVCLILFGCGPLFSHAVEHNSYSTIGTVCPKHKSTLSSTVSGKVEEVLVDVGDAVVKGQPICKLDTTLFDIAVCEATVCLESATIECVDAERNFERMKKLFEKPDGEPPSISQKRYEDTKLRFDLATIAVERAEESLKKAVYALHEAIIKAPYDGVIIKRYVHAGEAVTVQPVTKIVDVLSSDNLYVEFSIPQIYRTSVAIGTNVSFEIDGIDKSTGKVELIHPDVDERTRSIKCRAHIENMSGVQPGALVRVNIILPSREE